MKLIIMLLASFLNSSMDMIVEYGQGSTEKFTVKVSWEKIFTPNQIEYIEGRGVNLKDIEEVLI